MIRQDNVPVPVLLSVLYALSDAVVVVDAGGRTLVWNAAAESILGPAPADGEPDDRFGFYLSDKTTPCPYEDLPFVRGMEGRTLYNALYFLRNARVPLGLWIQASVTPIILGDAFQGGIVILRDVTRQRLSEQAAAAMRFENQHSEEKYRSIVTNIPGAVYRAEPEAARALRFVTEPIREIAGRAASEFLEHRVTLGALIEPEDAPAVSRAIEEAMAARKPYVVEYRIRRADGAVRWIYDKGRPVIGENGEPLWLDGVLFDLTDRKAAEAAVIEKTRALTLAEAEREQLQLFAYVASHDLREPLQKIMCFGDLLKMQAASLDTKAVSLVDRMQGASMRMGTLIDDILRFTKAGAEADPLVPVELSGVLTEVVSDLEVRIRKMEAAVEVRALPRVLADRAQVRQLFQNLVANAVKFAKKGEKPRVEVFGDGEEDGFAVIAVRDHGIGFEAKHADKIFKPFERLNRRDQYDGSGLGLAICAKIIARHSGSIRVESEPGAGTTFRVLLPAVPASA